MAGGSRPWGQVASLVAALVALIALSPLSARWLVREAPLERPDAILSLGSHERERFAQTSASAARWPDARVLLTVPTEISKYNCDACSHRIGWLESLGVSPSRVTLLSPPARNTHDEIVTTSRWMRDQRLERVLIVTSPHHTRRVRVLARGLMQGLDVGVVACPVRGGLGGVWWTRRYDRFYVVYEFGALLDNWWRYGTMPFAV